MAEMMIAEVKAVTGTVYARNAEGELRELKVGDTLLEGEVLVTPAGAEVTLVLADGSEVVIADLPAMQLSADMLADMAAGADESSVQQQSGDELLQIIEEGGDLSQMVESPAAGLAGGDSGGGHTWVRLGRIAEDTPEFSTLVEGAPQQPQPALPGDDLQPPQLQAIDLGEIPENTSLTFSDADLLTGATDADGDPLTVLNVQLVSGQGTLVNNGNGTYTFQPDPEWDGAISISFDVTDGYFTESSVASLDVLPQVDAVDDEAQTGQGNPVVIDVSANDDEEGGADVSSTSEPESGSVVVNGDGTITYTPDPGFTGEDTFTYTLTGADGSEDTATVTVQVNGAGDNGGDNGGPPVTPLPVITVSDVQVIEGETAVFTLSLSGASDQPVTVEFATADASASVTGGDYDPASGTITFAPGQTAATLSVQTNTDSLLEGPEQFLVNLTNPVNATVGDSATGTILDGTQPPAPANGPPVAANDNFSTGEDTPVSGNVLGNDSDPDNDPLSVIGNTEPQHGTVNVNADGTFTYIPDAGFTGNDTFTYTVSDGNGGSDTATVIISVATDNDPPIAVNDSGSVAEGASTVIDLAVNDSDPDDGLDLSSIQIVSGPANGSLSVNSDGTVQYTHDGSETTSDSFTYTIQDASGQTSNVATVNLTIGAGDDPVTLSVEPGESVNESLLVPDGNQGGGGSLNSSGSFQFSTPDGFGSLTIGGVTFNSEAGIQDAIINGDQIAGEHGYIVLTGSSGNAVDGMTLDYTYTLTSSELHEGDAIASGADDGYDLFPVQVTDADGGAGSTDSQSLQISILDDEPVDFTPQAAVVGNGDADSGALALNFYAAAGADGPEQASPGAVVITEADGSAVLNTSGEQIYLDGEALSWEKISDTQFQAVTGDGDTGFVVSISGDSYSVTDVGGGYFSTTSSPVTITSGGLAGGNARYFGIVNAGGSDTDIVISTDSGTTVNTSANDIGVGNQWITNGENLYFDFYSDSALSGSSATGPGAAARAGVNDFRFQISQGFAGPFTVVAHLVGGGTESFSFGSTGAGSFINISASEPYSRLEIHTNQANPTKFSVGLDSFDQVELDDIQLSVGVTGSDNDGDSVDSSIGITLDQPEVATPASTGTATASSPAALSLSADQGGESNVVEATGADQVMSATAGDDVFAYELADAGTPGDAGQDIIIGFGAGGDDALDLRDLLQGESNDLDGSVIGNLENYLNITSDGGDTVIQVSSRGGFADGFDQDAVDQTITLQGVDLVAGNDLHSAIQGMLDSGKLITD